MAPQEHSKQPRDVMTRRRAIGLIGGCAVAVTAYPAYRAASPGGESRRQIAFDSVTAARLQAILDELAARREVHQAILMLESGDGRDRWSGAAGLPRSGEAPATANTANTAGSADAPYFVASISKLYTAAVVLRLAEQRRLGLEDPIAAYLPDRLITGLHRLDGIDHTGAITVRHLLSHTSGLADYFTDRPKGGRSLSERILNDGDQSWNLDELAERVRTELVPHFPPQPADAERPKVRYSDTNYQILGAVIEAVTGRPLHRVFEEEIFRPLGLVNTYLFPHRAAGIPTPASIWIGDEPRELPLALASFGADGGIVSTAAESINFLRALLRGQLFDDSHTTDLLHRQWNRFGLPFDAAALQLPSWPVEYGLGMMRFQLPAMLNRFRPMPALFGHTGSTGSWLFHCPDLDVMIAGTVNQATAGPLPYRLLPRVLRALG